RAVLSEIEEGNRHGLEPHALAAGAIDGDVDIPRLLTHMRALRDQCLADPLAVFKMPASQGASIVTIAAHGAVNDFGFGRDAADFVPTISRTRDQTEPGIAVVRLVTRLRRCEVNTAANR
ncbi:hypothetical protein, partial [Brucella grignonensis]|uniref:hypothetical protein n=1 Tax=Brucella grignonensis TaxID=94627 RepID=UPI00142D4DFD